MIPLASRDSLPTLLWAPTKTAGEKETFRFDIRVIRVIRGRIFLVPFGELMSGSAPISLERRLDVAIEQWKRKLLDLTKRNRALNFKPTKVATVAVVGEQPAEVFRYLYIKQKAMRFG